MDSWNLENLDFKAWCGTGPQKRLPIQVAVWHFVIFLGGWVAVEGLVIHQHLGRGVLRAVEGGSDCSLETYSYPKVPTKQRTLGMNRFANSGTVVTCRTAPLLAVLGLITSASKLLTKKVPSSQSQEDAHVVNLWQNVVVHGSSFLLMFHHCLFMFDQFFFHLL